MRKLLPFFSPQHEGSPPRVLAYLAAVAGEAFGARAAEGLQGVLADAAVQAGLRVALVDLVLAVGASEA